ncbi:Myosin-8 [Sesamum angolense]|uniref:Myosin-8 n=1 Tax=Sesamum angolense TaxID=2727404 RepID=A0AAE1X682_9LAMI|nr:Myosin-8 [Sesamum angolense]
MYKIVEFLSRKPHGFFETEASKRSCLNTSSIAVGSLVWVEHPEEAWIDGEVVEVNGGDIKVVCTSGEENQCFVQYLTCPAISALIRLKKSLMIVLITANAAKAYPKDPEAPACGVDDMTKLAYLHEPGVLQNLKSRYDVNEIYHIFFILLRASETFATAFSKFFPVEYHEAKSRQMIKEGISQSILVSGESGAGKTESTKMLMCYLAHMGGSSKSEGRSVEQQVLESSPVLEAFGNAKTVRNNNSSRFGKFVELQFNSRGRISGAAIRTYLLERSRVCQVSDPERNYHCFYLLCAAPAEDREKYKLGSPKTYHYLNQSNCIELAGVDDTKEYVDTRRAMDVVGISSDEQDAIFRVVAAILHLGNIEFGKTSDGDASQPKDDQSRFHLKTSAELLMCNEKALEDSLCKRVMVTRDETITKSLNPNDAAVSRDALAKIIYSRLFDWLVNKINNSIGQDPESKFLIGVLDIYGFESFKTNSFEQFCINLTNEKLQQHFNQHVFKMEQEEYTREEIDWSYIEFVDNQDILDLIEKKPGGIIALLDEACMFPRSTHETFAEKLYQTFKDHKRFTKPKLSRTGFTICHYAGDVTYQTELFLDKNKDYVVAEHQALLSASNCSFVSGLFPPLPEESSKSSKFSSIGSRFKQQLQSLLETLSATEPHYIRCVKPNNLLKPAIFENSNVLQQLRCGGVMEAIRISCAGYPTRKTFDEFLTRFKVLAPNALNGSSDAVTACKRLLEKADLKGFQLGKTKVFLRAGQMAELDSVRNQVLGVSAGKIQRKFRTYLARKNFLSLRNSAIQIQTLSRGQVARRIYEHKRRIAAATTIQKDARMVVSRKAYTLLRCSAVCIQAGMRGMAARDELLRRRRNKAAIAIQRHCRGFLACHSYSSLKKAAKAIQCACRASLALQELRKLKLAARETGALQEAKVKLEEQVKELTLQLELEKRKRVEIEEAKNHEIAKLQSDLEEMQMQFQGQAANETSELQQAKTKWEKQIKELTLQLQLEKRMRADIEEAKNYETTKSQSALDEMQVQFRETKELLMKEREQVLRAEGVADRVAEHVSRVEGAADRVAEQVSRVEGAADKVVEQVPHAETFVDKVAEQVPRAEGAADTVVEQVPRAKAFVDKVADQVPRAEGAADNVLEQVHRAEGSVAEQVPMGHELLNKLTAENEKLKVLVNSLEKRIDETEKKYEETNKLSEERLKQALEAESKIILLKTEMQRLEEKISDLETTDQILRQQALINHPVGKASGHLVQTTQTAENDQPPKLFIQEAQSASVAKRFAESDSMRKSQIERQRDDSQPKNALMQVYLQENIDTLLKCITKNLGFSEGKPIAAFTIYKCLIHWRSFEAERTNVFDRLIQIIGSAIEDEANKDCMVYWLTNTSILLFLLQRTLRAPPNSPRLPPQPTSFFGRMTQGFRSFNSSTNLAVAGLNEVRQVEARYPALLFKEQLTAYVEKIYGIVRDNSKKEISPLLSSCIQASRSSLENSSESSDNSSLTSHWQSIIESLNGLLSTMKDNFVPLVLVQKIFTEIFSYINVQIFNSLLLHKECCTFKMYAGPSSDELQYVQQAVRLLVLQQKSELTYDVLTTEMCPKLSSQQLYRMCTLYSGDNSSAESVPPEVISSLKILTGEDSTDAGGESFVLDDNAGIPFSIDDICSSLQETDFTGVKPAQELLENPAFEFLQT